MIWYPWLDIPYNKIISYYKYNKDRHNIQIIHSQAGNGELSLCYAIICWLMCNNNYKNKSCGYCKSCKLIISGNHPDFYKIEKTIKCKNLGIDIIRDIFDKLYKHSYQGRLKIVWFPHAEQLTEQASNALLKILEEPPEKTYFLLSCNKIDFLLSTLKSRCLYWLLPIPDEKISFFWLSNIITTKPINIITALKLNNGAPLIAKSLLESSKWQERKTLCLTLKNSIKCNNFLLLLSKLNKNQNFEPLYWLLSLIVDAQKWQNNAKNFLINIDKIPLINSLANKFSPYVLQKQLQNWTNYLRKCKEIKGINQELLIIYILFKWK